MKRVPLALTIALAVLSLAAGFARADIFQWQWTLQSNGTLLPRQSTTPCPGGSGVDAVPSVNLSNLDLTRAYLEFANLDSANMNGTNLTEANLEYSTLANANLSGGNIANADMSGALLTNASLRNANLTSTALDRADLTGADFTDAILNGASLAYATSNGFTAAQLYSTASYKAKDLTGIKLFYDKLTGWDFTGQIILNADLIGTNLTATQLYSTASYQAKNLGRIALDNDNLTSWDFSGQSMQWGQFLGAKLNNANLSGANLWDGNLGQANLTNANLTGAYLAYADLSRANLTGADARGAIGLTLTGASSTQNLIRPDGSINGLDLSGARTLVGRNYTAAHIPIEVHTRMTMGTNGTVQVVLDGNGWGSTISFDPGIPVSLGGTLDVTFAAGVSPASLLGTPIQLFDWSGVTPTGQFAWQDDLPAGYSWDTSQLYIAGYITETPEPATLSLLALGAVGILRRGRKTWSVARGA